MAVVIGRVRWNKSGSNPNTPVYAYFDGSPPPGLNGIYGMVYKGKNYSYETPQVYIYWYTYSDPTEYTYVWEGGSEGGFYKFIDYYYLVSRFSDQRGDFPGGYGVFISRSAEDKWDAHKFSVKET